MLPGTLEQLARDKAYLFHSNKKLCKELGLKERAVAYTLRDFESAGFIHCIPKAKGRPGRIGIVLLRRADPDLPVGTVDEVPDIIGRIREWKARSHEKRTGQTRLPLAEPKPKSSEKPAPECSLDPHGRAATMPAPECSPKNYESLSLKNDETESSIQFAGEKDRDQRQRPDPESVSEISPDAEPKRTLEAVAPEPPAAPAVAELASSEPFSLALVEPPAAVPSPPAALTPRQAAFLAGLDEPRRARLEAKSEAKRRNILELVERGMESMALLEINTGTVPPPPPVEPETTRELIERLGQGGAPRAWVHRAVNAIIEDFGNTAGDQKLRRGFEQVFSAVWEGKFPAAAVADAYRQGMKGENHGAVFNVALQRDHGWDWRQERPHD